MNNMIDLELTPDWDNPDVRPRLADSLKKCKVLRSAVAYWTVKPDFVHRSLGNRLSAPDGFLCVDIHLPTDIDQLLALHQLGASIRLFLQDIPTSRENKGKEEPYLVHPKMLLFSMPNETAELWIGSHNWTRRALIGLNVEASLIVRMSQSSALFSDAVRYLEKIKAICHPFDSSRVEFYKELQRKQAEHLEKAFEIEAADAQFLQGSIITIFGTDPYEVQEVGTLRNLFVSVFEVTGKGEHIYRAQVLQTGMMPNYSPSASGLSFAPRRYAFRAGRRFPKLLTTSVVKKDVISNAQYFVVLEMQKYEPNLEALDSSVKK